MAVYAVAGGVLRDSVIHMAHFVSEEASGELTASRPLLFCLMYWSVFGLLILISLYLAVLDVRFVRLQYVLERKTLIDQNLRDAVVRQESSEGDKTG